MACPVSFEAGKAELTVSVSATFSQSPSPAVPVPVTTPPPPASGGSSKLSRTSVSMSTCTLPARPLPHEAIWLQLWTIGLPSIARLVRDAATIHLQVSPQPRQQDMQKPPTPPSSAPAPTASLPPKTSPRADSSPRPPAQEGEKPAQEQQQHQRPEKPKLDRAARRALQVRSIHFLALGSPALCCSVHLKSTSLCCCPRERRKLSAPRRQSAWEGASRRASSNRSSSRRTPSSRAARPRLVVPAPPRCGGPSSPLQRDGPESARRSRIFSLR